jgi:hypothetical protein
MEADRLVKKAFMFGIFPPVLAIDGQIDRTFFYSNVFWDIYSATLNFDLQPL